MGLRQAKRRAAQRYGRLATRKPKEFRWPLYRAGNIRLVLPQAALQGYVNVIVASPERFWLSRLWRWFLKLIGRPPKPDKAQLQALANKLRATGRYRGDAEFWVAEDERN
jgi:hypothetical protein